MQPAHRDKRVCMERISSHEVPGSPQPNKQEKGDGTPGGLCGETHPHLAAGLHPFPDEQLQKPRGIGGNTYTSGPPHTISQLDGPPDYHSPSQMAGPSHNPANTQPPAKPHGRALKTAINDILPYCTTETPLTEVQVIGMSDIAGNLKEVMLLALHARMDERMATDLVRAVGPEAASGIVEFFSDEFEIGSV